MDQKQIVAESAAFLDARISRSPEIGILTGTGLGNIADALSVDTDLAYEEIPHFPLSTVDSHAGRLLTGQLGGRPVILFQGRFHLYEGYSPRDVTFPIRTMQEIGVKQVILLNAAGGINPSFNQGDIMLIADHINLTGHNPLVGCNEDSWGPRFPDMSRVYDGQLVRIAAASSASPDRLRKGVYAGLLGPSLETPAEIRYLKCIGADAVGMSTVMEAIAAVHAGIKVLGISAITNVHDPNAPVPTSADAVIATATAMAPLLTNIICETIESMP